MLDCVDLARAEHRRIAEATRGIAAMVCPEPARDEALARLIGNVDAAGDRLDGHLTDIMLARDFHDLTGQVIAKVVELASELEGSLVKLLLQAAPDDEAQRLHATVLSGPVVDPGARSDVVSSQGEVDELLASLGL